MRKDVRKPRRSVLYVPGSSEKALNKSSTLDVDAIIYDLEDSVAPDAKKESRKAVIDIINSEINKNKEQVIRINSLNTDEGREDIKILENCTPDAVLIPKVNEAKEVIEFEKFLKNDETKIKRDSPDFLLPPELKKLDHSQKEIKELLQNGKKQGEKQHQEIREKLISRYRPDNTPSNVRKIGQF